MQPLTTTSPFRARPGDIRRRMVLNTRVPSAGDGALSRRRVPRGGRSRGSGRAGTTRRGRAGRRPTARRQAGDAPVAHAFVSRPDLMPPTVSIVTADTGSTPGHILLAPFNFPTTPPSTLASGPLIVDRTGQPLWFRPLTGRTAMDVRVQRYRGAPVLTWWEGTVFGGYGGTFVVADASYARGCEGEGRERLQGGPARVPDHVPQHRADQHLQRDPHRPLPRRRLGRRSPGRGRHPGDRHPVRARSCSSGTASTTSPWRSRSSSPSLRTATSTTCTSTRSAWTATGICSSRPGTPRPSTRCTAARERSSGGWAASEATSRSAPVSRSATNTTHAVIPTGR